MTANSIIAFDPGAVRTGIAVKDLDGSIYCESREPWVAVIYLDSQPPRSIGMVIVERWVPYPGAQHGNAWRDLTEVKTSGAIEWICLQKQIPMIYQPTRILAGAKARADAAGYEWQATNRDEKAAETHLYYYMNLQTRERK